MKKHHRNHTCISISVPLHNKLAALCGVTRRPLCREIEVLVEEECKRQGVDLPAENEPEDSSRRPAKHLRATPPISAKSAPNQAEVRL